MPQQLLHRAKVVTILEKVRRKPMPEAVRTDALRDTGPPHGVCHFPLHRGLVQMKARRWTPLRISTDPRGRKYKLPGPVGIGVGILATQCTRQHNPPNTVGQIPFMLSSHLLQVPLRMMRRT